MRKMVSFHSRVTAILAAAISVSAFRQYPLFKQCNSSWGGNEMGVNGAGERSTICGEGCAMSSLSMALNGLGVTINGASPDPATFNAWLEANNGYMCAAGDCNNLVLDAVTSLTATVQLVGEITPPSIPDIQAGLLAGDTIYLAHVHNRQHFVLLTGFDTSEPDQFLVNDPYFNYTAYPYANISDIIVYKVVNKQQLRQPVNRDSLITITNRYQTQRVVDPYTLGTDPVIPNKYPLYKQCDPRWGSHLMVTDTICQVGCLMSSTSMAIAGKGIHITGNVSTPDSLNSWLRTHKGYDSGNDMYEEVIPNINPSHISWPADGMHTTNDIPLATIQSLLKAGRPVIAWVMDGQHFVLVIGWEATQPDTLYVNDPGFTRLSYSYSKDVVGWRLFQMEACDGC